MSISVSPVTPDFVAEIGGIDLTEPVSSDAFAEIEAALERYAVLVLPDQRLGDERQIALTRRFGPLELNPDYAGASKGRLFRRIEVADFTNVGGDDRLMPAADPRRIFNLGNQLWHTDSSFKHVPAKCSLLSAREIAPIGGQTEFADLRAAYDALSEERQRALAGLAAEHSLLHSRSLIGFADFSAEIRAAFPPVRQLLVRAHPRSGRKSLYLAAHASHVIGRPVEEGRRLIGELIALATEPRFVYRHRWRAGDLVIWDNRCTMHRGRPYDDTRHRRVMHNTKAADAGNTVEMREGEMRATEARPVA